MARNGSRTRQLTAARITALSWDSSGGLWVSGEAGRRARVWWLDRGARPVVVNVPDNIGPISVLRVAPDGVRVAMVAGSGAHTGLCLAAIQRTADHMAICNAG